MTQTMSIRIDSEARKGLTEVCNEIGLSVSAAFNIFAKKVTKERRIPFELAVDTVEEDGIKSFYELRKEAKKNKLQGMTLTQINKIIADTRKARK